MQPGGWGRGPGRFRVAEWEIDPAACRLAKGDTEVHLRPLLMDLLVLLSARAGEVVTKDEIIERVWQGRFLSDSVLTRTMAELRRILGDDVREPQIIETIRKRGYRLVAPVEGLAAATGPRLAVLPFENLNRDPEHDYFAAGISDALTTELGNIASLQVISRQSVLALTHREAAVAEIARALRVDVVLEGSALHAGDRVRITAQLIQAEPERHLWAQTYVCEMGDILQTQGRVARAVAEAVEARLTPGEAARLARPRVADPGAHLAYLKARYQTLRWDRESLEKGFQYLQESLRLDPEYAPAHALLALAFTVLGYWGHMPVEAAYPRAQAAAETAVRLDGALGEAHVLVGMMRWLRDWDLDGCESEMREALELSPSSVIVHNLWALFLAVARGAYAAAAAQVRLTLDLDPLSMSTGFLAAWLFFFCRDQRSAAEQARTTLEMYPECLHAHYVTGWTALAEERHAEALAAFERAASISRDPLSIAYIAVAHARAGEKTQAQALLRELTAMRDTGQVPEHAFALIHAGLGQIDEALRSLERCFAARDSRIFWFAVPAIGGPLLDEPRFDALMRRVDEAVRASGRGAGHSTGGSAPA
jgi:TolB-like protein